MESFFAELEGLASGLRLEASVFVAQTRQDDADLNQIRANIYEVCATIGRVVWRTQPEARRQAAYAHKLDQLSENWQAALEAAQAHNDGRRAAVERLKLETLADVRRRLADRKEG